MAGRATVKPPWWLSTIVDDPVDEDVLGPTRRRCPVCDVRWYGKPDDHNCWVCGGESERYENSEILAMRLRRSRDEDQE